MRYAVGYSTQPEHVAFAHPDVADDEELGVSSVGDLHDAGGGFTLDRFGVDGDAGGTGSRPGALERLD